VQKHQLSAFMLGITLLSMILTGFPSSRIA
jgi:hypothetical protein